MYVSSPLIFTELHKTACSHIGKLLSQYIEGEQIGKHNRIPTEYRSRFVLGSVRNPWDWYVSLWGYGCDGRGSVHLQTCRRNGVRYASKALAREMDKRFVSPIEFYQQWQHEKSKPIDMWKDVYKDVEDVEGFRQWIKLMFDSERRFDIGEGFGFSPLSLQNGVLTYRFFKLFTSLDKKLYGARNQTADIDLASLWDEFGFVDAFVRQEELEDDFIKALDKAGVDLSDEQKSEIYAARNKKTNTSSRKTASHYYDEETARIIENGEQFIINKFNYSIESVLG